MRRRLSVLSALAALLVASCGVPAFARGEGVTENAEAAPSMTARLQSLLR